MAAADIVAPASDRAFAGHPVGLAYLAFMEAFERFSFYGMQALLVLYMTSQLLHAGHIEHVAGFAAFRGALERVFGPMSAQAVSSEVLGLYAGLCSLTPVFGGMVGDLVLGQKRAVLLGGALMATGHFLMAFEAPFLLALALLILGCGLLKGNISAQVGNLYRGPDRRRADAFQLFYMAANVGVFTAPLVCGTLGELVGWHWGFGAAGVGMLISLAIYLAGYGRLPPDSLPPHGELRARTARLTRGDVPTLAAMGVLLVVVALFWVANGEVLNAYMIWAKTRLNLQLGGFTMPATWLQSASAIVGICMAPILIGLWTGQARRGDRALPARQDGHRLRPGGLRLRLAGPGGRGERPRQGPAGLGARVPPAGADRLPLRLSDRHGAVQPRGAAGGQFADDRDLFPVGVRGLPAGRLGGPALRAPQRPGLLAAACGRSGDGRGDHPGPLATAQPGVGAAWALRRGVSG